MINGHVGPFGVTELFAERLQTVDNYIGPLMMAWKAVLVEDNRRGVLAGLDKDDHEVKPTHYRKSFTQAGIDPPLFVRDVPNPFGGENWKVNVSGQPGEAGFKPGRGHDLTTRQYQQQSGPPLAPRGMASRIISNYTVKPMATEAGHFGVEGGWDDFVSNSGREILPFHFDSSVDAASWIPKVGVGRGKNLPRRNMSGLRLWGRERARKELLEWIRMVMEMQNEYFERAQHLPEYVAWRNRRGNQS